MTFQHTNNVNSNSQSEKPAHESSEAGNEAMNETGMSATYSPDDNKLRLYPVGRLDAVTYARVKEAGFIWAPKQGLFVAPMWTPQREDLLISLCGSIDDEDVSLTERQEERAERFSDYSSKRHEEAKSARAAVSQLADGIPMGQPILIGHHSQARAERDARRIEDGMRKAVGLWHTAEYWERRAAGALRLAKYKERIDVRARRIKRIEADKRKQERTIADCQKLLKMWSAEGLTMEKAVEIAGYHERGGYVRHEGNSVSLYSALTSYEWTAERAAAAAIKGHEAKIAWASRWVAHFDNRLAYERAMLGEVGGLPADRFDIVPGGMVKISGEWLTVLRVTKRDGRAISVRTNARFVPTRAIEEVQDYREPEAGAAEVAKAATALGPIINQRSEGCAEMTAAEFKAAHKDSKVIRKVKANETTGTHRVRYVMRSYRLVPVFLTDAKEVTAPPAPAAKPAEPKREPAEPQPVHRAANAAQDPERQQFETLAEQLRAGVQIVTAPELFPTPAQVAARMVELAGIEAGDVVLEPSAGTGALIEAAKAAGLPLQINAIEKNIALAERLATAHEDVRVMGVDFFDVKPGHIESADVILMNPPFHNAIDIEHIKHARGFLKPGGRLVAICAGGPRQAEKLRPLVEECGGDWEPLPAGTFKASGTNVSTVLLTLHA